MPHHFFLSYSRADSSPLLKRFFDDLSDSLRIELSLPRTQAVGFYEESSYGPTSDWSDAAKEALQDSWIMVCLLSPAYLHSERAGKEWQVFEMRRRQTFAQTDGPLPESLAQVIVPVTWKPWHGPVPKVVNELLAHPHHLHQREALMTMFRSSGMSHGEYSEFVKTLANQIIEIPGAGNLARLDSLPTMNEVHSAFHLWDGTTSSSNKSPNQSNDDRPNMESVKTVREAMTSQEARNTASSNLQNQSNPPSHIRLQTKYSVFAISNDKKTKDQIQQRCDICNFSVTMYDPDGLLYLLESPLRQNWPDLFVVDLDEKQGMKITGDLSEKWRAPSEILLTSSDFQRSSLDDFGGHAILPKAYMQRQLLDLMRICVKIGRARGIFQETKWSDPSRIQRPVFLSYSHKNTKAATFLIRNFEARGIGVWAMHDALKPGDRWYKEIRDGLKTAQILVALITDDYLSSGICIDEISSFHGRVTDEQPVKGLPALIPVFYNAPDTTKYNFIENEVIKNYQYIRMSSTEYVKALEDLMRHVQQLLGMKGENGGSVIAIG